MAAVGARECDKFAQEVPRMDNYGTKLLLEIHSPEFRELEDVNSKRGRVSLTVVIFSKTTGIEHNVRVEGARLQVGEELKPFDENEYKSWFSGDVRVLRVFGNGDRGGAIEFTGEHHLGRTLIGESVNLSDASS
jgi:hypothetical protein